MLVLVSGGRDYQNEACVHAVLDALYEHPDIEHLVIMQGGARGTDRLAKQWCKLRKVPCITLAADWDGPHKKRAGLIRNQEMLEYGPPDILIAFAGGTGTKHMVTIARKAGLRGVHIRSDMVKDPEFEIETERLVDDLLDIAEDDIDLVIDVIKRHVSRVMPNGDVLFSEVDPDKLRNEVQRAVDERNFDVG